MFRLISWFRERFDIESRHRRQIDELRHQIRMLEENLKMQVEINLRDRERVAWETKHFARLSAEAEHGIR